MEQFIRNHVADFSDALTQTVATVDGKNLPLHEGLRKATQMIAEIGAAGKTLYFIGNGGSASITSHMSVDFWKTAGIKALAFTDPSLLTCISNDCGYSQVFQKPIEMFMNSGDILIAISSSGNSENILNGVRAARKKGAAVITMSGFLRDNQLSTMGDVNFYVPRSHYGIVEVNHTLLCHCLLDTIMGAPRG